MASNVFTSAFVKYGLGQYGYKHKGENGTGHTGIAQDGTPLVDCSGLVYDALRDAGYQPPVNTDGEYNTHTLFNGKDITQAARDAFDVISADAVRQKNGSLQIGDIIMFKAKDGSSQHMGIFFGYD